MAIFRTGLWLSRWRTHFLAGWLTCLAASGCGEAESPTTTPGGDSLATRDPAELYAWKQVPTFELSLPAERFQHLLATARDEVYTQADLRFEGQLVGSIGLRFKGSYGTLRGCFNSQGALTCPKLSMKLAFDEYVPSTRFFRQKKLNLHSMVWDETKLHERLAYDLFREMGIVTPRSAWAVVKVNGESFGLFSMVEQVDGRFAADRWPGAGDGNLYKEAWPLSSDAAFYEEHLETDPPNAAAAAHTAYLQFHAALSQGTPEQGRAALGRWMDVDYVSRYMAVDDAVLNLDGVTAMYTGDNPAYFQNHNFYMYQEEQRDFFWLIPWDTDATFTPRGDFEAVPRWNSASADCSRSYSVWGGAQVVSPACDALFRALRSDQTAYVSAVNDLLSDAFSEAKLNANIDRHAAFIQAAIAADPKGPGSMAWSSAVANLKQRIPLLRAHLEHAKTGSSSKPVQLSFEGVNDFEQVDAYSVALGANPVANTRSTVTASLQSVNTLAGSHTLRLDFEYRNESRPWEQWIYFPLHFDASPRNLTTKTGVRFLARSSTPRTLRIDIESVPYEAQNEGIKFGWEVPTGPEPKQIELRFADAKLPAWAHPTSDVLATVLAAADGFSFHPFCNGRNDAGFLPEGTTDPGSVELDNLEVF
ncbi:MAG: CotH kinase family protein [Myxococcota bacterium]